MEEKPTRWYRDPSRHSAVSKPSFPASRPCSALETSSFGLNPAAGRYSTPVFLHECVEAGLDAAIVHASKDPFPSAESTIGPKRSASTWSTTAVAEGYDPLQELLALFEGASATSSAPENTRLARRTPARAADRRRQPAMVWTADLHEALESGPWRHCPSSMTFVGRDEDRGRTFRLGRNAAALRYSSSAEQ